MSDKSLYNIHPYSHQRRKSDLFGKTYSKQTYWLKVIIYSFSKICINEIQCFHLFGLVLIPLVLFFSIDTLLVLFLSLGMSLYFKIDE